MSTLPRRTFLRFRDVGLVEPSRDPDSSESCNSDFKGLLFSIVKPEALFTGTGGGNDFAVAVSLCCCFCCDGAAADEDDDEPRLSDNPLICKDSAAFRSAAS